VTAFSDIQFDMAAFISPAQVIDDGAGAVTVSFPPVYTLFLPVKLNRTPTRDDQATLADALAIIEASYPASPSGLLIFSVSYGLPYFSRLPQALVNSVMPTLLADPGRSVLEEAVPFATDVTGGLVGGPGALIPNVTKNRFNVNVQIESNDMLFQFRSDSLVNLSAAALWLQGSNNLDGRRVPSPDFNELFSFQAPRIQFVQPGLPRKMADEQGFEFAPRINPHSSMAMGFVDQQVNASGPAAIVTFAGNTSAGVAGGRRHAAAHPGRRPWPRQHGRARLPDLPRTGRDRRPSGQQTVQAAVPDVRADRRPLRPDAHRGGGAAVPAAVPGRPGRLQWPGAVHHRDPSAELPGPAAQVPGLPVAGAHLRPSPAPAVGAAAARAAATNEWRRRVR
jgi:hypothetical protein